MKICVAGLGLIGGSMCMALARAGFAPEGWNRSPGPVSYALENEIISAAAEKFTEYDVVFVALPPRAAVNFINSNSFKNGAVVADICGVKQYIAREMASRRRNFFYVGTHPMAGKEVSGIQNACADLFDNAGMVIVRDDSTDAGALQTVRRLTKAMGFRLIVECSAAVHDRKIAYTSQLAHVVSNAYVKDAEARGCLGFTGGSFQDMTRIAGVDENVWAELYMLNSENLCGNVSSLISGLTEIKRALEAGDEEALRAVLRKGREGFASCRAAAPEGEASVTLLK